MGMPPRCALSAAVRNETEWAICTLGEFLREEIPDDAIENMLGYAE
jgi:hypothetical protein